MAIMPPVSSECMDLLHQLLIYDPDLRFWYFNFRINSRDTLKHAFFREYNEVRVSKVAAVEHAPVSTDERHSHHNEEPKSVKYINQTKTKLTEVDNTDAQSTTSADAASHQSSVLQKQKDDRLPVGMRRRSKKEYKVNSYGSKGSLSKVPTNNLYLGDHHKNRKQVDFTNVDRFCKGCEERKGTEREGLQKADRRSI